MDRNEVIATLKAVESQLRAHGVGALYLFGSYARDEARQDSDVDVFVAPGTQDFYSLGHFVGGYEVIRRAVPGPEIGYGTGDGLSKYIRLTVEEEAVQIFWWPRQIALHHSALPCRPPLTTADPSP